METQADIWSRSEALLGTDAMQALRRTRVLLFGVGGVGSWCAEALVRSGVVHLTMVDPDEVCYSNINRQLPATLSTVGLPKVQVLRERLLTINPNADILAVQDAFHADNADSFRLEDYDFVIDAIDSLADKAELLLRAGVLEHVQLLSSMGAARKMDPTRVRVAEFRKVAGDPLARALRHYFKHVQRFPKDRFLCVYSDEPAKEGAEKGSLMPVTAAFGLTLASLIINSYTS